MKKITATVLMSTMLFTMSDNYVHANDIEGHWMQVHLDYLIDNNIMVAEDGNYYPNRAITRAEFASFIVRAMKLEGTAPHVFSDVPPSYVYAHDIALANKAGIISGYQDGRFAPNQEITRQQMAKLLNTVANQLSIKTIKDAPKFHDANDIYPEYREAVNNIASYGLINGSVINGKAYFNPLENATRSQAAKMIHILFDPSAVEIDKEKNPEVKPTQPSKGDYEIRVWREGKAHILKKYPTLAEAEKDFAKDKGYYIESKGKILKMSYGLATTNAFTIIYGPDKKSQVTYISGGSELEYKNNDANWVEINLAGYKGFVKRESVTIKPYHLVQERSYYTRSGDNLQHYQYNHLTKSYGSYTAGKAPLSLKEGQKYYSWDGATFIDALSTVVAQQYNYYQFMPVHTATSYSAAELNSYIYQSLAELEMLYRSNPTVFSRYKDATKKSKLLNIGATVKDIEGRYNVNAAMIVSLAIHESLYGLSDRAQLENNLFGLYVTDSNPLLKKFPSVAANVEELMKAFWKKNYIPANAPYANGAVFGNKNIGFNVKYASDQYWGSKAAGHYYRLDKALGLKDYNQNIRVGITNKPNVVVYNNEGVNTSFVYKKPEMTVQITGETATHYKVVSDANPSQQVFINKIDVTEINTK